MDKSLKDKECPEAAFFFLFFFLLRTIANEWPEKNNVLNTTLSRNIPKKQIQSFIIINIYTGNLMLRVMLIQSGI